MDKTRHITRHIKGKIQFVDGKHRLTLNKDLAALPEGTYIIDGLKEEANTQDEFYNSILDSIITPGLQRSIDDFYEMLDRNEFLMENRHLLFDQLAEGHKDAETVIKMIRVLKPLEEEELGEQ